MQQQIFLSSQNLRRFYDLCSIISESRAIPETSDRRVKAWYLNASVAFLNSRLSGERSCARAKKKKKRKTSHSMWRINLTLIADRALTLRNPSGASRSRVK